jgi:hypothetical protein
MFEDGLDGLFSLYECDPHLGAALTDQRVDLEDPSDEIGPRSVA